MLDRRTLLVIAVAILFLGILGIVIGETGGPEGLALAFILPAGLTIFNPIFWIIFVILLFSARNRNGQQQQQQIVVIAPNPQQGPQLRCPDCSGLSAGTAAFCGHCGRSFSKA